MCVGQEKVFKYLGQEILDRSFEGYNACIFAYGQTGVLSLCLRNLFSDGVCCCNLFVVVLCQLQLTQRFSLFGHWPILHKQLPSRRTGGDHQDALVLRGWRLSSRTWNPITSPWMKQLMWMRQMSMFGASVDWLIEQGLTSPPTQYRLSGRRFYRSKDPTNSIKVLKEHKNTQITQKYNKRTNIQKHSKSPSLH